MEAEQLIQLIDAVSASDLTGFRYEENGVKLHLTKKEKKILKVTGECEPDIRQTDEKSSSENLSGKIIESPLVGTFYASPSEGEEAFVKVGDTVQKGQTLAIIEAMKLMNEIESEWDGKIAEVFVENEQAVEYGQPLFRIEQEALYEPFRYKPD